MTDKMEKRINITEIEPEATKAMYGLESYLSKSTLSHTHRELIKIRASQINGCAYCIDMHTKDALKMGETIQRIVLLDAWREVNDLYTKEEHIILNLTEAVTLIHLGGIPVQAPRPIPHQRRAGACRGRPPAVPHEHSSDRAS